MRKVLVTGALIGIAAALAVLLGGVLGQSMQQLGLLAVALGGVLILARARTWWAAPAGLAIGMVVAWVGYGLRALVLPDSAGGRAVAALLVVLVTSGIMAFSAERIPLWSGLAGIVAMVAGYERAYTDAPSAFLTESPSAFTTMLVGIGLGFFAATVGEVLLDRSPGGRHAKAPVAVETTDQDWAASHAEGQA